jgi:putative transposase
LSCGERSHILSLLHSERFCDAAPAQVWATLLDEGVYLGSESTFYRLLRTAHGDVRERRSQATHPAQRKPELVAHGPNRVWSCYADVVVMPMSASAARVPAVVGAGRSA